MGVVERWSVGDDGKEARSDETRRVRNDHKMRLNGTGWKSKNEIERGERRLKLR